MLNFRKLKHDFSPSILKEGKVLYEKNMVAEIKIIHLNAEFIRFTCRVKGNFEHCYTSNLEINLHESMIVDSECDCSYKYDCQHLASVLFYLESHYNELIIAYSQQTELETDNNIDELAQARLLETIEEAKHHENAKQGQTFQRELLQEYVYAAQLLGQSPFFNYIAGESTQDKAELAAIFLMPPKPTEMPHFEFQLSLRLPQRSKPLNIANIQSFLEAIRYNEPIQIGGKRYFFSIASFDEASSQILKLITDFAQFAEIKNDKQLRSALIGIEAFGNLLATAYNYAKKNVALLEGDCEEQPLFLPLPSIYIGSLEEPLRFSSTSAKLRIELDYLEIPAPKILLKPKIMVQANSAIACEEAWLFECAAPGLIYNNTYYSLHSSIKRKHLRSLSAIRKMTIPEPLFGSFVQNAMPELMHFAQITNHQIVQRFVTLPFVEKVSGECHVHFVDGQLEAVLYFVYGEVKVPAAHSQLAIEHILTFVSPQGILARNLTQEQKILEDLFHDFNYDPIQGVYSTKNDKKIVEFMTEIIPTYQNQIKFHCPKNLLDQFIYDNTTFQLNLRESARVDMYEVEIIVDGYLQGISLDVLWDCLTYKRSYIEISHIKKFIKRRCPSDDAKNGHKIIVLDLDKLMPIVQIFDEMSITILDNHVEQRPLWSLVSVDSTQFNNSAIKITITPGLLNIQQQIRGQVPFTTRAIPTDIQASLRNYQLDGITWLDRLRSMHLNGILADDMGLGKTLQAITTLTQYINESPEKKSIVVCPTSLVYNWKEEFAKFNPLLKILAIDGNPGQRKKLLSDIEHCDIIITSYTLLQKDIEFYKTINFGYAILDEAQHIKNRSTRNAQSVKMIQAAHRLILTGTPIENSLDELWSLFDFLMPGLLSTYDRFVEKYIRHPETHAEAGNHLENLRNKVAPFILRRMKKDVLHDLPPISEMIYYCHLSDVQRELYRAYANSARAELSQLVQKEGFDRVQIHVLATLTRLKQICCHPAIFAKDQAEHGDSSKYDLLQELLQTLIAGRHKTIIFSQYTRMLSIMRDDLQKQGINFEYLDGSSKNRLSIVKKFNEDPNIPIFLVSLKAGGSGLNLVGANTVIHYDMWWTPAVDNQATDRVHRLGQTQSVSSYKLITLNTIEEKILELHKRKNSLVKDVVSHDEDMMTKLTWEEVLELLKT